jgi:hypothetical protein
MVSKIMKMTIYLLMIYHSKEKEPEAVEVSLLYPGIYINKDVSAKR